MKPEDDKSEDKTGTYIKFDQLPRGLIHHPTDFTIRMNPPAVRKELSGFVDVRQVATDISRVTAESFAQRDELMKKVQERKLPVHHVYRLEDTKEELVIADRIYLTLLDDQPDKLKSILDRFPELDDLKKQIGRTHVLHVSDRTKQNPLKIANQITELDGVQHCSPKVLPAVRRAPAHPAPSVDLTELRASHELFERQWHLTPSDDDDVKGASINVQEAWELLKREKLGDGTGFGDPNIVIAVIDDGFDVKRPPDINVHPVFFGKDNDDARNFVVGDGPGVFPRGADCHGTPVASIAIGSLLPGNGMLAVAPNCGFLPLRIALTANIDLEMVLEALQIASESADVVNCSFALAPLTFNIVAANRWFVESVREMTEKGGKRGKGLVIVFGAGNDDAPTFLAAEDNKNGIRFPIEIGSGARELAEIKKDFNIHTGFPELPDVVVVSAMSSFKRKAGYSNWGQHVTVAAPSDNGHDMKLLDDNFKADYPGRKLIAAVNRPPASNGFGKLSGAFSKISPSNFTESFGGTSGAAPIVAGVVALILSANDQLTAAEVIEILKDNTDTDLSFDLDLKNDPNLQGVTGEFNDKHSHFFGAGKVNAGKAVQAAYKKKGPGNAGGIIPSA